MAPMQRIEFARENLRGIQQLIALMDQKSYLVLVITGVTSAAFFSIVGGYLGKLAQLLSPALIVPLTAAWFLVEAGLVLCLIAQHSRRGGAPRHHGRAVHGLPARFAQALRQ